jgi:hypothetical protein
MFLVMLGLVLSWLTVPPSAALERRCGWPDNPTPTNWFLEDAQDSWTISVQMGYRAQGLDTIPDISVREYVRTNGYYGYACACMDVKTDKSKRRILSLTNFKQLPLKQCRRDLALPKR